MPVIKQVSDLRHYNEKNQATIKLFEELAAGEQSGREKGWLEMADVEKALQE